MYTTDSNSSVCHSNQQKSRKCSDDKILEIINNGDLSHLVFKKKYKLNALKIIFICNANI